MLDTYQVNYKSKVTSIANVNFKNKPMIAVELMDTIAHPQGGGQPSDLGTINGIPFVHVQKRLLETSSSGTFANNQQYFAVQHLFSTETDLPFEQGFSLTFLMIQASN